MITVTQINELRKETQVSMLLCKQALEATGGDFDAAKKWLRSQGGEVAGGPSEFGFTFFADGAVNQHGTTDVFTYSDGHSTVDIRGYSGTSPSTVWADSRHQFVLNPAKA